MLDNSSIGADPVGIFITVDDTIFLAARGLHQGQMWLNGSTTPARVLTTSYFSPSDVFVTSNGDIYVDKGAVDQRVDKWELNTTTASMVLYASHGCSGLFVDINNYLYCSSETPNQVIKRSLSGPLNSSTIAAGNGVTGGTSDMLSGPRGLFVDRKLRLYVADFFNNRVQLFSYGRSNGTTVAGNGATGTITLNQPADVILDADGHLFIADSGNNRIVASGPNGFRCIIACSGTNGSTPDKLSSPVSLSFDRGGNLFVTDSSNGRIQKFLTSTTSCGRHVDFRTSLLDYVPQN